MGVSTSWGQLAGKLATASAASGSVPAFATRAAGEAAAGIIRGISPARLSGVGRGGARLGVRVSVVQGAASTIGYVRATGPWQLIEGDTRPHGIKPKGRGKARALRLGDGAFYARVQHPGTKGKHLFAKGARTARPLIPRIYQQAEHQALARIF